MQQRKLLLVLVVLASVVIGLLAGIIEYADEEQLMGAIKYGGAATGGSIIVGLTALVWLRPS